MCHTFLACWFAGLTAEGQQAQETLLALPGKFRKIEERRSVRNSQRAPRRVEFSWVYDRPVSL